MNPIREPLPPISEKTSPDSQIRRRGQSQLDRLFMFKLPPRPLRRTEPELVAVQFEEEMRSVQDRL